MKRILLATDFSDSCQNALKYLSKLVRNSNVKIDLVHVYDIPVSILSTISYQSSLNMIEEKKQVCENRLSEQIAQFETINQGAIHAINGMYPSVEIAEIGVEINADLIVMALRQKYSLIDKMIGSITAFTIQKSDIPILAIPNGAEYSHVSNILFPTAIKASKQLSGEEQNAIDWLFRFYKFTQKPKIHMIHIKNVDPDIIVTYKNNPFPSVDFIRTKATSVDEGIIQYIESHKIDLMAFYKPNRSYWERLYHSSVSRKLLFKSRIPLLIF